jgi:hypothetical protein
LREECQEHAKAIADFIARVLVDGAVPEAVLSEVVAFREPYQALYYCVEHGLSVAASR